MQKRRKTRSKQAPCVRYYRGIGLVEPCPWSVAEQTAPDHWSYERWKDSKGDRSKYMKHMEESHRPVRSFLDEARGSIKYRKKGK